MPRTTKSTSASACSDARAPRLWAALFVALAVSTPAVAAGAPPAPPPAGGSLDCPSASEEAQRLRDKSRYLEAREHLRSCSRASCPSIVRKDCAKWLAELDESLPTVVIAAQDGAGKDLADVRVWIDGKLVASRVDGSPLAVDPGEHELRVEADRLPTASKRIIMRTSEKNRLVRMTLGAPAKAPGAGGPPAPATPQGAEAKRGVPVISWVLGGVGVAALGGFAFLGLTGKADLSDLRSSCAPYCEQSQLDETKTKLLVADISLGVGVVALGAALWFALTNGPSSTPARQARAGEPLALPPRALP